MQHYIIVINWTSGSRRLRVLYLTLTYCDLLLSLLITESSLHWRLNCVCRCSIEIIAMTHAREKPLNACYCIATQNKGYYVCRWRTWFRMLINNNIAIFLLLLHSLKSPTSIDVVVCGGVVDGWRLLSNWPQLNIVYYNNTHLATN